jgi:hypothetical protein
MTESDPAEPLLELQSPELRAVIQELRGVIGQTLPTLTERVHMGWKVIHYMAGSKMTSIVVAIDPQRNWANLMFADGALLQDPSGRLEGTGKKLRHVKVRTAEDAHSPELHALLEQAARIREVSIG